MWWSSTHLLYKNSCRPVTTYAPPPLFHSATYVSRCTLGYERCLIARTVATLNHSVAPTFCILLRLLRFSRVGYPRLISRGLQHPCQSPQWRGYNGHQYVSAEKTLFLWSKPWVRILLIISAADYATNLRWFHMLRIVHGLMSVHNFSGTCGWCFKTPYAYIVL